MSVITQLVQSVLEFPGMIADVAAQGPIQAILVLFGALFIGLAVVVIGLLVLGVAVDVVTPPRGSPTYRPD
jgi:hypothetical protein